MPDSAALTADELRAFRRRITVMRVSVGCDLVVALVCVFTLGHLGPVLWLVPVVPAVLLTFALYVRAYRCPRCRRNVWNPPPGEDGTPGLALFGPAHPDHCRACGVRLARPEWTA
jgi:hypothetical protein